MTTELSIEEIIRNAEESVFLLRTGSGVVGTGFVISPDGHILTCNHVVDTETIEMVSSSGKSWMVPVLARDGINNLAMLKVDDLNAPYMVFADPISVNTGQKVYALGHPLGLDFTVSQGIVSNRDREIYGTSFVQTDVALNPGNSGGPIINERGEVIGVADSAISVPGTQGLGFVVAVRHVFAFSSQLRVNFKRTSMFKITSNPENSD